MAAARYTKVLKLVREAEDLARSGALVLDDGAAAIYFLWGQPSHAYMQVDEERIEGEAALKEIALSLARPGKVTWKSKDVLAIETLRCNAEDLIEILESMSKAGTTPPEVRPAPVVEEAVEAVPRPWDGGERRRGPALHYSVNEFPLLPSGPTLWAEVPTSVVHLDVLIGTLQDVLVVFETSSVRAVGVVCEGERYDAMYIDEDGVKTGRVAWELMIGQREGTVSAYEISTELARTLPVLWRNRIVHRDLDTAWINRPEFLAAQRGDSEDRALIIATADVIGIGLFAQGHAVAAYTTVSRTPMADVAEIQALLAQEGEGRVTVLERVPEDVGDAYIGRTPDEAPLEEAEDLAAMAGAFSFQPIDSRFAAAPPPPEFEQPLPEVAAGPTPDLQSDAEPEAVEAAITVDAVEPTSETEPVTTESWHQEPPVSGDEAVIDDGAAEATPVEAATDEAPQTPPETVADAVADVPDAPESAETAAADEGDGTAAEPFEPDGDAATRGDVQTESGSSDEQARDDSAEELSEQSPLTDLLTPSPVAPPQNTSLPFTPQGSNVGLNDFASMLTGGQAPPPAAAAWTPPSNLPTQAATRHLPDAAASDAASDDTGPPAPPDFSAILAELVDIGNRFLGPDFAVVEPLLADAPRTPAGLRVAISTIRRADVPNQPPETVQSMARAMVLYVADRVSAV